LYQTRHGTCAHLSLGDGSRGFKTDSSHGGWPTILLVEDDRNAREALREILIHAGYSVLPAENGRRALESVEATGARPALILLDLAMPVMDGVAFLSRIPKHAQLAHVPVIVMSGDFRASRLRAERPDNVMEVLPKPIDVSRMMELVRRHSGQPSYSR
jgi:two-component system, chemotaxis family, chemotaxis protein CheY